MTTTTFGEANAGLDLSQLFASLAQSVRAIWSPSQQDIDEGATAVSAFFWGVAGPLLTAPAPQLMAQLHALSKRRVLQEFDELMRSSSVRAWMKSVAQRVKLDALRPVPIPEPTLSRDLGDDLDERWKHFLPYLEKGQPRKGFRLPPKADLDEAFAAFFVSFMALKVAAGSCDSGGSFSDSNVRFLWERATGALGLWTTAYGVEPIETSLDRRRAVAVLDEADAAQAAYEEKLEARRSAEVESLHWSE